MHERQALLSAVHSQVIARQMILPKSRLVPKELKNALRVYAAPVRMAIPKVISVLLNSIKTPKTPAPNTLETTVRPLSHIMFGLRDRMRAASVRSGDVSVHFCLCTAPSGCCSRNSVVTASKLGRPSSILNQYKTGVLESKVLIWMYKPQVQVKVKSLRFISDLVNDES